jgi:hypothetical protein
VASRWTAVSGRLRSTRDVVKPVKAGEVAIGKVAAEAGFTRFRRAAQTPFDLIYEIRP